MEHKQRSLLGGGIGVYKSSTYSYSCRDQRCGTYQAVCSVAIDTVFDNSHDIEQQKWLRKYKANKARRGGTILKACQGTVRASTMTRLSLNVLLAVKSQILP